ncbi:MAG: ester cyclase [Verrucomicrobiota bacterium]
MSSNKTTSKHFLDHWGDNTPHLAIDYVADVYVNHQFPDAAGGTSSKTFEQWKELVTSFHEAFSDVQLDVCLQVEEGNYVCSRWRMTAKHTGPFRGLEGTGNTASWTGVSTDRFDGDKLVETWVEWDKSTFLEGLGLAQ